MELHPTYSPLQIGESELEQVGSTGHMELEKKHPVEKGNSTVINVRNNSLCEPGSAVRKKAWWRYVEVFVAEVVGTGLLMAVGCMGGVPALTGLGSPSALQSALTFGIVVGSLVQVFGPISAAHFNPAVTACFYMQGALSLPLAAVYFVAEMLGAVAGLALLKLVTPSGVLEGVCLCCTQVDSSLSDMQAVLVELLATSVLILVVCSVTDTANQTKQDSVPVKFALLITALSLAMGPYTNCSMNPARSFAPSLINGNWDKHWVYWVGPLTAGFLVPVFYQIVLQRRPAT